MKCEHKLIYHKLNRSYNNVIVSVLYCVETFFDWGFRILFGIVQW